MVFDPFGDHSSQGYLRNLVGETDVDIVKRLEHTSVKLGLEQAIKTLSHGKPLTYQDLLKTHKALFESIYPWAGQDRLMVGHDEAERTGDASKRELGGVISKGPVTFMPSSHAEQGIDYALKQGNDPEFMRENPGVVMGNLAYAHPFLDGNGRALMVVHGELAARSGFHIDWSQTNKDEYLKALTEEINSASGQLDAYLKPFIREGILSREDRAKVLETLPGLSALDAARSQSGKDPLDVLSERLIKETDLARKSELVDQIMEVMKARGVDHQELIKESERFKSALTEPKSLARKVKPLQRASRDDGGYGL